MTHHKLRNIRISTTTLPTSPHQMPNLMKINPIPVTPQTTNIQVPRPTNMTIPATITNPPPHPHINQFWFLLTKPDSLPATNQTRRRKLPNNTCLQSPSMKILMNIILCQRIPQIINKKNVIFIVVFSVVNLILF